MIIGGHFDLDSKKEEIIELIKKTESENFWNNREESEHTLNELNTLKELVAKVENLELEINTNLEIINMIKEDDELLVEIETSSKEISSKDTSFAFPR